MQLFEVIGIVAAYATISSYRYCGCIRNYFKLSVLWLHVQLFQVIGIVAAYAAI